MGCLWRRSQSFTRKAKKGKKETTYTDFQIRSVYIAPWKKKKDGAYLIFLTKVKQLVP